MKFRSAGLTLVEALISLAVGSVLSIILLRTLTNLINTQRLLLSFNRLEVNTHRTLNQLQDDIRWAQTVNVPDEHSLRISTAENLIVYQWDSASRQLSRAVDGQIQVSHPDTIAVQEFTVNNLRSTETEKYQPLIDIILTSSPTDPRLVDKLTLETNTAVTVKTTSYAL